jgi:hypothetical protein
MFLYLLVRHFLRIDLLRNNMKRYNNNTMNKNVKTFRDHGATKTSREAMLGLMSHPRFHVMLRLAVLTALRLM